MITTIVLLIMIVVLLIYCVNITGENYRMERTIVELRKGKVGA